MAAILLNELLRMLKRLGVVLWKELLTGVRFEADSEKQPTAGSQPRTRFEVEGFAAGNGFTGAVE